MGKLILAFLMLLLLPILSSQSISIEYNEEVFRGEEFIISLNLVDFDQDIYDVKIDIIHNGERIAKIFNNNVWKSTYYYIIESISPSEKKEFRLKVEEYIGSAEIMIKIRGSTGSAETFSGYTINILDESGAYSEDDPPEDGGEDDSEQDLNVTQRYIIQNITNNSNVTYSPSIGELIFLNSKDIKGGETNKKLEKKDYALYGLLIFCILLVILFSIKFKKRLKWDY
jgi:hypothetical protein